MVLPYSSPVTNALSVSVPLVRLDDAHRELILATLVRAAERVTDSWRVALSDIRRT